MATGGVEYDKLSLYCAISICIFSLSLALFLFQMLVVFPSTLSGSFVCSVDIRIDSLAGDIAIKSQGKIILNAISAHETAFACSL